MYCLLYLRLLPLFIKITPYPPPPPHPPPSTPPTNPLLESGDSRTGDVNPGNSSKYHQNIALLLSHNFPGLMGQEPMSFSYPVVYVIIKHIKYLSPIGHIDLDNVGNIVIRTLC